MIDIYIEREREIEIKGEKLKFTSYLMLFTLNMSSGYGKPSTVTLYPLLADR